MGKFLDIQGVKILYGLLKSRIPEKVSDMEDDVGIVSESVLHDAIEDSIGQVVESITSEDIDDIMNE